VVRVDRERCGGGDSQDDDDDAHGRGGDAAPPAALSPHPAREHRHQRRGPGIAVGGRVGASRRTLTGARW
jgi:hypothetical protein